ncbi:SGNH/GDSL hydrolase family protein [Streptomyces tricolor]|nr:SGNH/GDSL hydrolase family protein [Streptomyces tricolor]
MLPPPRRRLRVRRPRDGPGGTADRGHRLCRPRRLYSSGVGAGDYLASGKECKRSSRAYPVLWAEAHAPASFSFAACSGAGVDEVLTEQLGHLSPRTGLVTLTVGGSDTGFVGVLATCSAGRHRRVPVRPVPGPHHHGRLPRGEPRPSLHGHPEPGSRRPCRGARLPAPVPPPGRLPTGLGDSERADLNDAVDHLNAVIARRAAAHGFTFADVTAAFAGHEICSARPWLRSVDVLAITESYHPTAPGQSLGYLPGPQPGVLTALVASRTPPRPPPACPRPSPR